MFKEKWALITGASTGIGLAFAKKLAAEGANLVLVARRGAVLQQLATEIIQHYGVKIEVIALDLADLQAPQQLYDQLQAKGLNISILVNNAGMGVCGEFYQQDMQQNQQMLLLNIHALVMLTRLYLPALQAQQDGVIFNIASIAAFQPLPYMASYAATKAFVLSFSEAVEAECRPYNVRLVAVCPGATATSFFTAMGSDMTAMKKDSPEIVVYDAFYALKRGKTLVVCGHWSNWLLVQLNRFTPRWLVVRITEKMMRDSFKTPHH
ncbi:MAG: SDR family NAD(P)-dependent oxidoreductase [Alphaproteobacteria bacterium]